MIQFFPAPQRGCEHPHGSAFLPQAGPTGIYSLQSPGEGRYRQQGRRGQFQNNFFFSIYNLLGSMEAGALLWVGSRVMGWGLEKVRSCFYQLRPPAGKERTALK